MFRYTEKGEKVRVSKRTGQIIPVPPDAEATVDYAKKSAYKRNFFKIFPLIQYTKNFKSIGLVKPIFYPYNI